MAQLLTAKRQQYARRVLYDILLSAGFTLKPVRNKLSGDAIPSYLDYSGYTQDCNKIANEIINRKFTNINSAMYDIYRNGSILVENDNRWGVYISGTQVAQVKRKSIDKLFSSVEEMALGFALVAKAMGLYWDDTAISVHEKTIFEQTYLGAAVEQAEVYLSQQSLTNSNAPKAPTKTRTNTPKAAGAAPQNGYKSSGPQSGNVRDLKGNPGDKIKLSGTVFKIEGVNAKSAKNKAKLYIKPLEASGAKAGTNKVLMGSANGYTDCVCHFTTASDAHDFMMAWASANSTQTQFTNVQVVRKPADANGYFLVGTEYGDCYVSAGKLNEQLGEDLEQETPEERQARIEQLAAEGYKPTNPNTFDENFNNYDI
jgi:hypothetical protein